MTQAGRPLKFKSVKELQKKIEDYFESCFELKWFDEDKRDEEGEKIKDAKGNNKKVHIQKKVLVKPISITGLAIYLNTSRETLLDYQEKDEFSDTIKRAKDYCHNYVENGVLNGKINPAAGIFNLKNNYGWKDKTEVDSNIILKSNVSKEEKEKADELINNYLNDHSTNPTIKRQ
jgi:hypothetical protein